MIGLITDDDDNTLYQQQLDGFVNYCDANYRNGSQLAKMKKSIPDMPFP